MRIALIYPPPWKIPAAGEAADAQGDGPPPEHRPEDLDPDFYQIPYGLLSLAAQAMRAGHEVKVLNLSAFPWSRVVELIAALSADVFGLSCWTANRRGVGLLAKLVRERHPGAHIVVGGPHASPLWAEMLRHHPEIDTVCIGESEATLLELLDRLGSGKATAGVAGTAARQAGRAVRAPERAAIVDLDTLASPHDHFATHIVMTSRGCPFSCSFCGAESAWGRGFRAHSVGYVLDALGSAVARAPVKMLQVKDDTFTTDKKRVFEICRGIRERGLRFLWSCDTRVDLLTEPLLREMRLAGCERLSLGVESGSQAVLTAIGKKTTVAEIERATELAKQVGIRVRYYMMLGNRGETAQTFRETQRFLERARPHEYLFSCLSIYPGTRDFADAEKAGWLDRDIYFTERFQELKTPFDASDEDTALMDAWFRANGGIRELHRPTTEELRGVLDRLGEHHAAHLDLAGALFGQGDLEGAERHARRALDLGYPAPGLAHNYLACIAKARGDYDAMMERFSEAARTDPQHWLLVRNVRAAREWFQKGGPAAGPLDLAARHDFRLLERTVQPTLPGPLPDDIAAWPSREVSSSAARQATQGGRRKR